ncbi:MAG: NAD(P)H-dependent oxidoreductase subunit E [Planctomycetota bacterium]
MTDTLTTRSDTPEVDPREVDAILEHIGHQRHNLVPLLQAIQEHYRYLPREVLLRVCRQTDITPAQLAEVATFYSQFRHRPAGEHVIQICHGTACHVKGAQMVTDALQRELNIPEGNDTDPDGQFTVMKVACLGCCTLAPAMQIDGITYGHLTPTNVMNSVDDFLDLKRRGLLQQHVEAAGVPATDIGEVRLCIDSCCVAAGTIDLFKAFDAEIRRTGARAVVTRVGCVLMCHRTPMVEVAEPGAEPVVYANIRPEDVSDIVHRHFPPPGLLRRLRVGADRLADKLVTDRTWRGVDRYALDVRDPARSAFMGPQVHIALEGAGRIDPTSLDDYRTLGGFRALQHALDELTPEQLIEQVEASGLRGRGGAGFPTGRKWRLVHDAPGDTKHILCNGDEGDPGAFMDRMLLESYPYRVIEGMIMAGFAVGAAQGTLYIRHEYPLAVRQMTEALETCRQAGLLGRGIAGSGFDFELSIMQGAGAFVCGEETAMIASLEGRRGSPRLRPPYPDRSG